MLASFAVGSPDVTIDPENEPPVAKFDYWAHYKSVSFTDESTDNSGSIVSWNWTFGDGNISNEQNPIHEYSSYGTYTVTLNVTDEFGASNETSKDIDVGMNTDPYPPELISPKNNTQDASHDTELSVHVNDLDGDRLIVKIYQRHDNGTSTLLTTSEGSNNRDVTYIWTDRTPGETYKWYATVSDGNRTVTSDIWTFAVQSTEEEAIFTLITLIPLIFLTFFGALAEWKGDAVYYFVASTASLWLGFHLHYFEGFNYFYFILPFAVFLYFFTFFIVKMIAYMKGKQDEEVI